MPDHNINEQWEDISMNILPIRAIEARYTAVQMFAMKTTA